MDETKKEEILEKVKKLLALADKGKNTSEAEAEAAMLKAQKLMAEFDISIDQVNTETITYADEVCKHKWNMGFRKPLGVVIGENFRCRMYLHGNNVVFMGHTSDAKFARQTFEYAYVFILEHASRAYNKAYTMGAETKGVYNSYALGFIQGLKEAFGRQCQELMIVTPPDVNQHFKEMSEGWKMKNGGMQLGQIDGAAYATGLKDGKHMMDKKSIKK